MGAPHITPGADGSPTNPYAYISDAVMDIPDNGTLVIKTGSDLIWESGGVIDRPLSIKGIGVTISGFQ